MSSRGVVLQDTEELHEGLQKLVAMRKRNGVIASSEVTVLLAKEEIYIAETVGNSGTVRVKMGPEEDMEGFDVTEDDAWALVVEGSNFMVWEKR